MKCRGTADKHRRDGADLIAMVGIFTIRSYDLEGTFTYVMTGTMVSARISASANSTSSGGIRVQTFGKSEFLRFVNL